MKKIFLTGGTGFIGKTLLASSFPEDAQITILSRDPDRFRASYPAFARFRFLRGDVRTFSFPEEAFDWILHGAATSGAPVPDEEMESVILSGTERVLQFARHCGAKRVLFVSSGAVYGIQDPALYGIPETHPAAPVTVYGKSKLQAERMCLDSGMDTVIARGFAFIGPYLPRKAHFAAGNFLEDVLQHREVTIRGDGRNFRSYLDASDLARALKILLERGKRGEIYNVGSARAVSIRELAEIIVRVSGLDLPVRVLTPPGTGPAPRYVPDVGKLSALCPERITLEESVRRILHPDSPR